MPLTVDDIIDRAKVSSNLKIISDFLTLFPDDTVFTPDQEVLFENAAEYATKVAFKEEAPLP